VTNVAVSVIMPAYNVERYVGEAIRGILDQTFGDFELLIRDDGSTDGTLSVIRGFGDPRIVLLPKRNHVGAAQARNDALAVARGAFIAPQDADDIVAPTRLEREVSFLRAHPGIGIVGTFGWVSDARGRRRATTELPTENQEIKALAFDTRAAMIHASAMFRRELLERAGGYDPRFRAAHDYDLILRILEHADAANIPIPLYGHRRHSAAISVKTALMQLAYADLARDRSRVRRQGGNPDVGEYMADFEKRFDDIEAGRFPSEWTGRNLQLLTKQHIRQKLWNLAIRYAVRLLRHDGFSRDNFWLFRQALKGYVLAWIRGGA